MKKEVITKKHLSDAIPLESLPNEIIISYIFRYLDNSSLLFFSKTSRLNHMLTHQEKLKREIDKLFTYKLNQEIPGLIEKVILVASNSEERNKFFKQLQQLLKQFALNEDVTVKMRCGTIDSYIKLYYGIAAYVSSPQFIVITDRIKTIKEYPPLGPHRQDYLMVLYSIEEIFNKKETDPQYYFEFKKTVHSAHPNSITDNKNNPLVYNLELKQLRQTIEEKCISDEKVAAWKNSKRLFENDYNRFLKRICKVEAEKITESEHQQRINCILF